MLRCWSVLAPAAVLSVFLVGPLRAQWQDQSFGNDGGTEPLFGDALDLAEGVLAAGVAGDFGSTNRAFVFRKSAGQWVQEDELFDPNPFLFKSFGRQIATNGAQAVVGSGAEEAYVYAESGGSWTLTQTLPSTPQGGSGFGRAVAMDGDTLLVGAPSDDTVGVNFGAAWVYRWNGVLWVVEQHLLPATQPQAQHAVTLAIDGDVAALGATGNTVDPGEVRIYRRVGASWTEEQLLVQPPGPVSANFGASISIDGDRMAVVSGKHLITGASGGVFLFEYDGVEWVFVERIGVADEAFTPITWARVQLEGNLLCVGTPFHDGVGDHAGAVQVFRHDGTRWWPQGRLAASDAEPGDFLGADLAFDGTSVLAGMKDFPFDVYAFTAPIAPPMWVPLAAGSPGASGVPWIDVAGTLFPGELVRVTVNGARPFAPSFLVVGASLLGAPFKGGVLVPQPDLILDAQATDGDGTASVIAPWPPGLPPLFTAAFQYWIVDDTGSAGFTSTQGLLGTVLP